MVHSLSITNILPARVKEEPGGAQLSSAKIIMVFFKNRITGAKSYREGQADVLVASRYLLASRLLTPFNPVPVPPPSLTLRASQFRAISPFCIQGGPVVCQNNGDPDQNYSRQRICE